MGVLHHLVSLRVGAVHVWVDFNADTRVLVFTGAQYQKLCTVLYIRKYFCMLSQSLLNKTLHGYSR